MIDSYIPQAHAHQPSVVAYAVVAVRLLAKRWRFLVAFIATFVITLAMWFTGPVLAVDYGDIVPAGEHLPVGQVITLDGNQQMTGWGTGTLIAPDMVLTAAHVVLGAGPGQAVTSPAHIRFRIPGEPDLVFIAMAYRTHPGYYAGSPASDWPESAILSSDLAVIRLSRPVPEKIKPYKLVTAAPVAGLQVTAVGFGIDESKSNSAQRKMSGQLKYVTEREKQLIFASLPGRYQRTDSGDSGGPLLAKTGSGWEIVATVRGKRLFESIAGFAPDEYGDYISVRRHKNWIDNTLLALADIPTADEYVYLKTPTGNNSVYPPMTMQQLEGLTRSNTNERRIFQRAFDRGICEPLPAATIDVLNKRLGVPPERFFLLKMQAKPVEPGAASPKAKSK